MAAKHSITEIRIDVARHAETGALMAYSEDIAGLMVPARSQAELESKLPAAIRELLEAAGAHVFKVERNDYVAELPAGFVPPKDFSFSVALEPAPLKEAAADIAAVTAWLETHPRAAATLAGFAREAPDGGYNIRLPRRDGAAPPSAARPPASVTRPKRVRAP